jgi:phosphohistidine phosphatase
MKVYLIRHAHAVDPDVDPNRPLSKRGRAQVRRLAMFLSCSNPISAREIWHSPLARSLETAKRLRKKLSRPGKLMEVPGLEGGDDPAMIAERLKTHRTSVAVVGHEPHLSALATLLVAGVAEPARFVLKKSAVLALERKNGSWAVCWQVSPELLD